MVRLCPTKRYSSSHWLPFRVQPQLKLDFHPSLMPSDINVALYFYILLTAYLNAHEG